MSPHTFSFRFCRWTFFLAIVTLFSFDPQAFSAEPVVQAITVQPSSVRLGGSFNTTFSGAGLSDQTYFDVRVVNPDGAELTVLNWQRGAVSSHNVPVETAPGIWKITGVRAHETQNDH